MTTEEHDTSRGQLGRRLLAAFLLVALSSVAVLTAAALVGTVRGLSVSAAESRESVAQSAAAAAAAAYSEAGGWDGAQLQQAEAIAAAAGLQLVVQRPNGARNNSATADGSTPGATGGSGGSGGSGGQGNGGGDGGSAAGGGAADDSEGSTGDNATGSMAGDNAATGPHVVTAPVVVDGTQVGVVRLVGAAPVVDSTAQRVAWTWILAAAAVAIATAFGVAWFVSKRIAAPLTDLTDTARAFAAGDRDARPSTQSTKAPGELGELARSFATTADIVAQYEQSRRRMTADIAHEIRTPLAALQAGLEEVRDGLVQPDADVLAGLHAQSMRLGRIIGDLSQLSEAESADLTWHRERVDLTELVADAVASASPAMTSAGLSVRLTGTEPVIVQADPGRLHQALSNLLMNTVRHCRRGDRVSVGTSESAQWAEVTVADTGPGIAEADQPLVFERLWRGSADSDTGGLGIGLAVVKAVAEAHAGTIEVDSDAAGTVFTLKLPRASAG